MLLFLLGLYIGGSFVVFMFWANGQSDLENREKSFYRNMMFVWPFYALAITAYRIIKYFKGEKSE